ncbi:hypothetical protein NCF86_00275 [Pelagerythrobacter marinus]|nr:hypothetical protein NCF86_00275 [Pelagerythrobacter marinus]
MAKLFWVTFRIGDVGNYDARYQRLNEALASIADNSTWWVESTSFFLFQADTNIDGVAEAIACALDLDHDLALVGMPEYKSARAIGAIGDPDLYKLLPFAKKY